MSTASEVPQLGRNWWLFLILGLVSLCAGVLAIVYPGITLLALGIFIGVSLMFMGAMEIVEAIAGSAESRALSAITGVLAMLAGLVCLRRPGESLLALVIVLGFYLVVTGVIRFVRSFSSREDRVLLIALAILDIVLGILILSLPKLSLVTLAVLFAISLLARGLFAVVVAFKLRGASHARPPRPESRVDRARARQRPDHPDVEPDHDQRPDRVVRDEEEVGERAQHREHDRRHSGPRLAGEQAQARGEDGDADDQVDPAPGGDVEVECVVACDDVELVVEDGDEPREDLEDPRERHQRRGEGDRTERPTGDRLHGPPWLLG
jgi:uncharacterized membrane protein HdeD (DUF308 family)